MLLCVKVILAYLTGSISGSLLLGRLRGVDIRTLGSGNAGSTNALRTQGPLFALGVVAIDIGKGAVATGLIAHTLKTDYDAALLCGAAAVVGHIYPVWHGFRGGKGAATLAGVLAVLQWTMLPVLLIVWFLVIVLSGYVGLASICAVVVMALWIVFLSADQYAHYALFGVTMASLIVFTHRSNIARMRSGTENRNERLWLFGRNRQA